MNEMFEIVRHFLLDSAGHPRHVFELTRFLSGMQDLERNSNETYPFERPFSMSSCTAFEGGMLSIFTALALDSSSSTWVYVVMRPQFKEISVRSYPSDSWNVMQMYLVYHSCADSLKLFFFPLPSVTIGHPDLGKQ